MCLIGIAYQAHPQFELVLAANRDEFHARPTTAAGAWSDAPHIHGGRDGVQGGGWLALSTHRRLAAVTNVRRMVTPDPAAPSRGKLVADFLRGRDSASDFAQRLAGDALRYAGFNLLLWDGEALLYLTNEPTFRAESVTPGIHGLSNATLDTPWPKLRRLTADLRDWTSQNRTDPSSLLTALGNDEIPADSELPDTGVGLHYERFLAPPFIRGGQYGTRASTVVMAKKNGARFVERRFGPEAAPLGDSDATLSWVQTAQSL